ncbi:hypothetical protein ROZALSC1DRAFT_25687, partial [Rozella allomycis CSF55]
LEEIIPFDIYHRINDFLDVKSSERFRLTKKSLYHNVALNADIVFHWFRKCGPYFNVGDCGQDDIQKFYKYYQYVLDPNAEFKNIERITKEDLIKLLIKQKKFTPFNCYNYNVKYLYGKEDIDPLAYCIDKQMSECIEILIERNFYLESLGTKAISFVNSNPFIQEMNTNIKNIRNLIELNNFSDDELKAYKIAQSLHLQPIDQKTMSYVLFKASNENTRVNSNILHLAIFMLQNHINALSYSSFQSIMNVLSLYHPDPVVVVTIINEALKTKFALYRYEKRRLFFRLFQNDAVATHDSGLFTDFVKFFPEDGPLLFEFAFTQRSHKSYTLLKQSGMFAIKSLRKIWDEWRKMFYSYLEGPHTEKRSEHLQFLLNSFDDVDTSRIKEVNWVDVFSNHWTSYDKQRITLFKKILECLKLTDTSSYDWTVYEHLLQ